MLTETIARMMSATGIPDPPPLEPFALLNKWYEDARASGRYDDPNAMALATSTPDGRPSVRIVLCKDLDPAAGTLTFYTNFESRKGQELAANPRAAVAFHWSHAKRQVRVEGRVDRVSDDEADAYFATRPLLSRIGAVASRQSTQIASRADLVAAACRAAGGACLELGLKRPAYWGGFRLVAHEVELWSACEGRLHQRVRWSRDVRPAAGAWRWQWLSP